MTRYAALRCASVRFASQPSRDVHLGGFTVDLLRNDIQWFALQNQPFQILLVPLEHPGRLVARDELKNRHWRSDTFVDFDRGPNQTVNRLRLALNNSSPHSSKATSPSFLRRTLWHGRGKG